MCVSVGVYMCRGVSISGGKIKLVRFHNTQTKYKKERNQAMVFKLGCNLK